MVEKQFGLKRDQIRPVAVGYGACIASDTITVRGEPVGFMYREAPDGPPADSGWHFLSGTESDEYMNDPRNFAFYNVNTIANYDPEIVPFLESPIGSAYARRTPRAPLEPVEYEPPN